MPAVCRGIAGPDSTQRKGELLSGAITRRGEGVDFLAMMNGDLGSDVSGGAKAVNAYMFHIFAGQVIGTVAD